METKNFYDEFITIKNPNYDPNKNILIEETKLILKEIVILNGIECQKLSGSFRKKQLYLLNNVLESSILKKNLKYDNFVWKTLNDFGKKGKRNLKNFLEKNFYRFLSPDYKKIFSNIKNIDYFYELISSILFLNNNLNMKYLKNTLKLDEEDVYNVLKQYPYFFKFLPNDYQNIEFFMQCYKILNNDQRLFLGLPNHLKTEKICLKMVEQNPGYFRYVPAFLQKEELFQIAYQKCENVILSISTKSPIYLKYYSKIIKYKENNDKKLLYWIEQLNREDVLKKMLNSLKIPKDILDKLEIEIKLNISKK